MYKKLMIGLFALSLAVIWISEANAYPSRRARSVGVSFEYSSSVSHNGHYFATGIYGLEAAECDDGSTRCGEIRGTLYCAEEDNYAAKSACYAKSGVDRALVAVLDPDAIPGDWPKYYYNFDEKDFGQRLELFHFDDKGPPTDPNFIAYLPAGTKKNRAGWHFIDDPDFDLENYRGTWDSALGKFIPEEGYGINGEQYLQGVPLDSKYGAGLGAAIDGKVICAFWHHDQIKWQGDSLHGTYYGISAFYASYNSENNTVEARMMDAKEVCGGQLYNDVNAGVAESEYQCLDKEDVVFAPAPYTSGDTTLEVNAFPEVVETITCDPVEEGFNCWGVAEIDLNSVKGQELCEKHFTGSFFVDFVPINNECGKAFQGYVIYYGVCDPSSETCPEIVFEEVSDNVYCSEEVVEGDSKFLLYECDNPAGLPADCVGLGQSPWAVGEALTCPPCQGQ